MRGFARFLGGRWLFCLVFLPFSSAFAAEVSVEFVNATRSDGKSADAPQGFNQPHDVVLSPDGSKLYVADVRNDVVQVLDAQTLEHVGMVGRDVLDSPHDVAFDTDGTLLVADSGNNRIAVFELDRSTQQPVASLGDGLFSPEGIAADQDHYYITNTLNHEVQVLRKSTGKVKRNLGTRGNGQIEFIRPHDIDVGPDDYIYVADPGNDRIQVFDRGMKPVRIVESTPRFNEPKYLALDENGWVYVADEYNHQVKIFDTNLDLVATIGSGRAGTANNELNAPEGVEVRGDRIWVSDTHNHRIVQYRLHR